MMIETDDYVTIQEAAEFLNLTVGGVHYRRLTEKIHAVKVGNTWLVSKASLNGGTA